MRKPNNDFNFAQSHYSQFKNGGERDELDQFQRLKERLSRTKKFGLLQNPVNRYVTPVTKGLGVEIQRIDEVEQEHAANEEIS